MAKRKRSRKSWAAWLSRYVGDLRHMLQCCRTGRLPPENCDYLRAILQDHGNLPSPKEIAERVQLTYEQREQHKLRTIPPVDKTKQQLAELRREKDRQRKIVARRRARVLSREAYLAAVARRKPWIEEGVSRATWFRRKAKARP